jgi:molybdenum cofactor guanylyltransferase
MGAGVSLLVLAGGRSTRLGQDKVWLPLNGQPLVLRVISRLAPLASEVIISTNAPEPFRQVAPLDLPLQLVADQHVGMGPLAGIQAGLNAARNDLVITVASDMPFVNRSLIQRMLGAAAGYDVVVPVLPHDQDSPMVHEPLHAIYRRTCLPAIAATLAAGERRVVNFFPLVRVREIPSDEARRYDPELLTFLNLNTPQDWQRIQDLARSLDKRSP